MARTPLILRDSSVRQLTVLKVAALSKHKLRLPPTLLHIHGSTKLMLESRALKAEKEGRCVIHNGAVHFYETISDAGYNSGAKILKWVGRKSGQYGPTVLQAIRT